MMSRSKFVLLQCLLVSYICHVLGQQEGLAFPETIENKDRLPSDNREPLYMQTVCAENELYYPGDQKDDWICDCKPGYIYYGDAQKCYPAFEQGPCDRGEKLVLSEDGHTPICSPDICILKNKTMFENTCVKIGAPCDADTRRVYGVNEKTIKIECLPVPSSYKFQRPERKRPLELLREATTESPRIQTDPEKQCLPGCQRKQKGDCTDST